MAELTDRGKAENNDTQREPSGAVSPLSHKGENLTSLEPASKDSFYRPLSRQRSAVPGAEFFVRGAINQLTLFFQIHDKDRFSGGEIARILLATWRSYELSKIARCDAHLGATE